MLNPDALVLLNKVARSSRKNNQPALERGLRHRAFAIFRQLTSREAGYPRILVFQAYQAAALERMQEASGEIGEQARVILDERFPPSTPASI